MRTGLIVSFAVLVLVGFASAQQPVSPPVPETVPIRELLEDGYEIKAAALSASGNAIETHLFLQKGSSARKCFQEFSKFVCRRIN